MMRTKFFNASLALVACCLCTGHARSQPATPEGVLVNSPAPRFEVVTLEASLKPFKQRDTAFYHRVAEQMFTQWQPLLRYADTVSVMLWTSDGSEILDYSGDLAQPLEWARYIGNPNTQHPVGSGPASLSLHERAYLYMDDPPEFAYGDLKQIVGVLKSVGRRVTGKPILVGATFDPGPEFARSDFKYNRHPEILGGNAMGHKSFVSCYSVLEADTHRYAGFPGGIPAKTPFGTFFGRQSQHFLDDLDFDYIWFSNGFGFGAEGWSATGALFTGVGFMPEKLAPATARIIDFWERFRAECPTFPIYTRGTNLSVGADLARDAVDLRGIYRGNFNIIPPPNSPWAALDGDFGLELVGYLSRMAELPDSRFPFRYYTHDPWWINSPWLDRYGREPHDIYLPMAVSRIDRDGRTGIPTHLNFLTVDDSFGNMPDQVPNEVIPHILKARKDSPTAPGPLVWVYPFDEYHDWAYVHPDRLPEIYYGDWVIRQAINNMLPLNTVISTTALSEVFGKQPSLFEASVLFSIVPDANTALERTLIDFVEQGGKLVVYGPADRASDAFSSLLNLANTAPISGEVTLRTDRIPDRSATPFPASIRHDTLFSAGGIRSALRDPQESATTAILQGEQDGQLRDLAWVRALPAWKGGKVAYVRATNSSSYKGGRLLTADWPGTYLTGPNWLRYVLEDFGYTLTVDKADPTVRNPVLTISRSSNAFVFAGYQPNNTVATSFRLPQGAPLLLGWDTQLEEGAATYRPSTAWQRECRVFIEQDSGMVACKPLHSGELGITERYQVTGLANARLRIFPPEGVSAGAFKAYLNAAYPWKAGAVPFTEHNGGLGRHFVIENVTGQVVVAW